MRHNAVELLHLPAFGSPVINTGLSGEFVNAERLRQKGWFLKEGMLERLMKQLRKTGDEFRSRRVLALSVAFSLALRR